MDDIDPTTGPRGSRGLTVSKGRLMVGLASAVVMAATGAGWAGYHTVVGKIITSRVLMGGPTSQGLDQNILLMGLDSRLDQNGRPLPQDTYDALHAGDETSGGYNANVLILVHLSAGGGPVTAVSIPRDDYVELSGCPASVCKGKIKQAYGLAYQQALDAQASGTSDAGAGATDLTAREQTAREAGRKAEIDTVRDFLGVPIDHFVEVTLGGFFQIAKVVEPVTVCLNADTADDYSGADFHQGVQQIDAAQAMAFVRQRRDENDGSFTDLDRTRRQQAFLVSLVNAIRRGGAISSPGAIGDLLRAARDNVAVDSGLDLVDFATHASQLTDRAVSMYTLPIADFGQDSNGSDVNLVDVSAIRQIVRDRFTSDTPAAPMTTPAAPAVLSAPAVLNVVNATGRDGLAAAVEDAFVARGFTRGRTTTAAAPADSSTVEYGSGAYEGAQMLAEQLHLSAVTSGAVGPGIVQLTVGGQFPADDYLPTDTPGSTLGSSPGQVRVVSATGTGAHTPAPTDLTQMTATGTACVK